MTIEQERLDKECQAWRHWGPYLAERAWGTVREDYSAHGDAWNYFPHDHARSRVYRWNEDGLAGISDSAQRLCFALAMWNGRDPILKERLFGLSGPEGNHGEDVKEYYYYLDATPTHSYLKMLYKYPQAEFPYARLVEENRRRGREGSEYELIDTGVFEQDKYFDVFVEYAEATPNDVLIRLTLVNRGPEAATLTLLPTLWFRNTWSWGRDDRKPSLRAEDGEIPVINALHHSLGEYKLYCESAQDLLFTENETNNARLFNAPNASPYVKDAFHEYVIRKEPDAVNPARAGTKGAALYSFTLEAGASRVVRMRLRESEMDKPTMLEMEEGARGEEIEMERAESAQAERTFAPFSDFDSILEQRIKEADEYYDALHSHLTNVDLQNIQRQALAGILWSKEFYHYDVAEWLEGDPMQPTPPPERKEGRNSDWITLNNADVLSMPDKWEYPWYASWDLAFHCIALALVDPEFAKRQLVLMGREWYQHPNGQIPAYEWAFDDVDPPVLAWAAWRVYKIDKKQKGTADRFFLERVFHKLLMNFTWWVNRKDSEGNNIFEGGFLGLDNIGVFDRSAPLPTGGHIEQCDGTSWMAMFCLNMMVIALELASGEGVYEDIATKFFEHYLFIAGAMNNIAREGISLWDDGDEFFYDVLHLPDGSHQPLKVRSMVGLIPLFAVETLESSLLEMVPEFKNRLEWFLKHRPDLAQLVARWHLPGMGDRRLVALVRGHRMKRLLKRALDPNEFLGEYGIRALSKYHEANPYVLTVNGNNFVVKYEPAESRSGVFGGNSNWRGPIWFPVNYLLIESLQKFHHYYSDDFKVECPTGSGQFLTLNEIADFLSQRLIRIFTRDENGRRAFNGAVEKFQNDPHWRDHILFYEYFHGDNGAGIGASHQTGWTGVVAKLIQQQGAKMKQ